MTLKTKEETEKEFDKEFTYKPMIGNRTISPIRITKGKLSESIDLEGDDQLVKDLKNFIHQIRADDEKAIREDERNKIINMIDGEYIIATDDRQFALHTDGYNNAIEDIIDKLKENI